MASTKGIYEAEIFAAGIYAAGVWRGDGSSAGQGLGFLIGTIIVQPQLDGYGTAPGQLAGQLNDSPDLDGFGKTGKD